MLLWPTTQSDIKLSAILRGKYKDHQNGLKRDQRKKTYKKVSKDHIREFFEVKIKFLLLVIVQLISPIPRGRILTAETETCGSV